MTNLLNNPTISEHESDWDKPQLVWRIVTPDGEVFYFAKDDNMPEAEDVHTACGSGIVSLGTWVLND